MKVMMASTEEQEKKLTELIRYMYDRVFPCFFTKQEIKEYIQLDILKIPHHKDDKLFTMEVSFQAITSLQVIITILEMGPYDQNLHEKEELFNKNVIILEESGLSFPFTLKNFDHLKNESSLLCSMYSQPANDILV